ncbi:MAG: HepT-like ribonuclease domain-containing protein [Ginsengibacter sp.]
MQSIFSDKNVLYLLTILEAIEKIKIYARDYSDANTLFNAEDQMPYNGICHLLLAIGEESKKIEITLKETQSFISWDEIEGLRNRIAHDYRGIDKDIVFQIVAHELDTLGKACEKLLQQLELSKDELKSLLRNPFYKHLQHLPDIISR